MRLLAFALSVSFLLLSAGCLGSGPPAKSSTNPGALSTSNVAATPTSAGASPPSANVTSGASDATRWVRDVWANATTLPILSATQTVVNVGAPSLAGCIECVEAFFKPPKGTIVPPGTASIEVTATYTPPATAPGTTLLFVYRTASDAPPVQGQLASGTPVTIPLKPGDSDAPLQVLSNWWFDVFPDTGSASVNPGMDVKLVVVAKRAATLPEFPPAPDAWLGKSSRPWTTGDTHTETFLERAAITSGCGSCSTVWESKKGSLVPPGAKKVEATISWTWPGPTKPDLSYWSAAIPKGAPMKLAKDGDTARSYEIEVGEADADSPYQTRSSWGFFFTISTNGDSSTGFANGDARLDVSVSR